MTPSNLVVRAGPQAIDRLRREGFHPELFGTLVGASGGPKWLVLRHLDDVLIDRLILPRTQPLDTLGSSIGSFRHACYAQNDPHTALARFAEAYIGQAYAGPGHPTMREISTQSDRILGHFLGEKGAEEIARNQRIRNHVVAARLRADRGLDRGLAFKLQLVGAALANAISRRALGRSFTRILFGPEDSEIRYADMETQGFDLSAERVRNALLASGSIPMVMEGVRGTSGVPGVLFDGGIIDYHFDFEFRRREGLVLFPHFFDRITPGWFDKPLRWRRPNERALGDVVMLAPSDAFVASLPGGKVPDRNDFLELDTDARIARWNDVVERSRCLADEFGELIENGRLAEVALPFRD